MTGLYASALAWLAIAIAQGSPRHVSPITIDAIIHAESRGNPSIVKHEANGSCSVGLMGINVPDCNEGAVARLLVPAENVRAGVVILVTNARYCAAHKDNAACKRGGAVGLYNPGDKAYPRRIRAVEREIRKAAREKRRR